MMQRDVYAHAGPRQFRSTVHLASDMPASNVLSWGMTNYFDLTGKVALVTGGSRGLGYQMVKAFAAHGADVFITSRKLDACEKVAAEVARAGPQGRDLCLQRRQLAGARRAGRRGLRRLRQGRHPGQQCRLLAAGAVVAGDARAALRPHRVAELQGPVPPDVAGRQPHGGGRGRLDHQHLQRRRAPAHGRRSRPMPAPRRRSTPSPRPLPSSTGPRCGSTPSRPAAS